ncbi:hypothetical protein GOBAR_AA25026 [Gossypium barbadense]|uniref:Uncharacterized protein n=2 Tax=Gossypium TaxID=3633 RepID=A0ABR0MQ58_GOSAR|nr:hypothetical protein PVK06_044023 [Gossypium arboreum]PPR95644.1 hypothetical protein GOBAR_AA25026 [Gossypium barbadense]
MANSVIVWLMGRAIGYRALVNRLMLLWELVGEFHVVDLENDFFIVKFSMVQDYNKALSEAHIYPEALRELFLTHSAVHGKWKQHMSTRKPTWWQTYWRS